MFVSQYNIVFNLKKKSQDRIYVDSERTGFHKENLMYTVLGTQQEVCL